MKIRSITATPFRLPFAQVIKLSTGARSAAEHVLVEVTTQDGVTGAAECVPRPTIYGETFSSAPGVIEQVLAPRVIGVPVSDLQAIHTRLAWLAGNPTARAAIELAAFDALAKTAGVPAFRLLGGFTAEIACCPMLGYGAPDVVVSEARVLRDRYGVQAIKYKVGPDLAQDVAVARALREALGDEMVLYPDANQQYSASDAERFLERTRDCGLRWIEEPTDAAELESRRRLAQRSPIPVLADESAADPARAAAELIAGRSTGVSIKLARTGIVASVRIRELAASLGVPVVIGSQGDSAIGALAAAAFAASSPVTAAEAAEVMFYLGFADHLLADPPQITGGRLVLPQRPGFGFDVDPDQLTKYAVR